MQNRYLRFFALLMFVRVVSLHAFAQPQPAELKLSLQTPFRFIAYGDTRFTNPSDTKAANPNARLALVQAIADAKPAFISIGGDIAYDGNKPEDWKVYDEETAVWTKTSIAVFPALGNHDLHGDQKVALGNYFARYPQIQNSRYYSVRASNVLMLTLDSNQEINSGAQFDWLKSQLAKIDSGVDFVVLVFHHPPYTSSSDDKMYGGGHSARASEQKLAAYLEDQQKSMRARIVVFNGHVHNYEHHLHGGIHYFVTGGGGAHAYPIERRPDDLFKSDQINYHYIEVLVEKGKMTATMHRVEFKDRKAVWTTPDTATIAAQEIKASATAK
jgi:Icc-related predicted phosphoesterase